MQLVHSPEVEFLGLMAIALPFQKPLAFAVQVTPSCGPMKQWLNSNWAKMGQQCNFLCQSFSIFFSMYYGVPQGVFWAHEEKPM